MITKEIKLEKYKFIKQYTVSGHYEFEIEVEYENNPEKTIYRRYSEIRALYKLLLLKCPGCYIPNIPEKTLWLNINYPSEEQLNDRMNGIKEFLSYLVHHEILRKNKYVINFFSTDYKRKESNSNDNTKSKNIKDDFCDDNDEDLFASNKSGKTDNNENGDNNDDDNIEPLRDYVEEYNNRNKGIVSKGKKLLGSMYNYLWSYAGSNNNNEENKEEKNNNNINDISNQKLTKEDDEFIKKKTKELGEDFEINDYKEKISRLSEGVKNLIDNFEKLTNIHKKNIHSLENIINNDNCYRKLNRENSLNNESKNENVDKFYDEEETTDQEAIKHRNNISKISKYCVIQRGFMDKSVSQNISKMNKYLIVLQGLLEIYSRKKDHITFLGKLHSQKEEMEKEKEKQNVLDPIINDKIKESEKKINHQIKFINKINKDLKYEIKKYKENEEDIYIFINAIFKDKANSVKNNIQNLNKENDDENQNEDDKN